MQVVQVAELVNLSFGMLALRVRRLMAAGHGVDRHVPVEQFDDSVIIELREAIAVKPAPPLCITEGDCLRSEWNTSRSKERHARRVSLV